MLRALVVVLLLANGVFWAYTQGYLAGVGLVPDDAREPQRLMRQVAPQALVVLNAPVAPMPAAPSPPALPRPSSESTPPPDVPPTSSENQEPEPSSEAPDATSEQVENAVPTPGSAMTPAPPTVPLPAAAADPLPSASLVCWQASGLPRPQEILVRAALENMLGIEGLWTLTEAVLPARWIVYLGPFPDDNALQQRRAELRRAGVDHRELSAANLVPGLALGTYSTREAAQRALGAVARQGVAGARVLQERPDTPVYTLRLEGITDAQKRRIESMGILRDRPLQACP